MGDGVFGNPITDETLEGLPQYEGKKIGPIDRARVALTLKNAEGKDAKALQYAKDLQEIVSANSGALCLIYNATGGTLEYVGHKDWNGGLGPSPYPMMIQNGQWGVFFHRQFGSDNFGSVAAVVYRGTNAENRVRDWMVAWTVDRGWSYNNRAYAEVAAANSFNTDRAWATIRNSISNSDIAHKHEGEGGLSFVSIGRHTTSTFRAVLTLQ